MLLSQNTLSQRPAEVAILKYLATVHSAGCWVWVQILKQGMLSPFPFIHHSEFEIVSLNYIHTWKFCSNVVQLKHDSKSIKETFYFNGLWILSRVSKFRQITSEQQTQGHLFCCCPISSCICKERVCALKTSSSPLDWFFLIPHNDLITPLYHSTCNADLIFISATL